MTLVQLHTATRPCFNVCRKHLLQLVRGNRDFSVLVSSLWTKRKVCDECKGFGPVFLGSDPQAKGK
jgi:hypothetical protein